MQLAIGVSLALAAAYITFSGFEPLAPEDDIEFVCPREHPDSVSCGWPVYLPDGTRIEK